jgi:hypothetical protein
LAWPQPGQQTLTVRLRKTDTGDLGATIKLMQGSTLIAFVNVAPTEDFEDYVLTLTDAQIRSITDYTDLRVRVTAGYPIQADCCPNALPDVLVGTVSDRTGSCVCLPGTVVLAWNDVMNVYQAPEDWPQATCGFDTLMYLACPLGGADLSDWTLSDDGGLANNSPHPSAGSSCSPLSLVFDCVAGRTPDFVGTYRLTVTP